MYRDLISWIMEFEVWFEIMIMGVVMTMAMVHHYWLNVILKILDVLVNVLDTITC